MIIDYHSSNQPKKSKKKHKKKRKYLGCDEGGGSSGSPKRHKHKKNKEHRKRSDRPDAQPAVRSECSNGKIRLKISYPKPANLSLDMSQRASTSNMADNAPESKVENQEQKKGNLILSNQ